MTVIGLALFAMFFGAGNLIFPPDIGVRDGSLWWLGFIFYFIADAGFALLAVIAMNRMGGNMDRVTGTAGRVPGTIINIAVILCIGPGLAIPRNGATTLEMGIAPAFGLDAASPLVRAVFSVIFFGIVLLLVIRPSAVVDILGRFLTPILVITLLILIVVGIFSPRAATQPSVSETIIKDGIYNGYQTIDLMAGLFFAIIVIENAFDRGYYSEGDRTRIVLRAGAVSCVLLGIVYGGLSFLGSTTGMIWRDQYLSGEINQAGLFTNISSELLGSAGSVILALIVTFACLTTAIGLTSAAGSYFSELFHGKISYSAVVILVCVVSAILCNAGLSQIISFTFPILMLCYPIVVLTVIMSFLTDRVKNRNAYYLASLVTFFLSACSVLCGNLGVSSFSWVHRIPLDQFGFYWVIPAAAAFLIGMIIPGKDLALNEGKQIGSER